MNAGQSQPYWTYVQAVSGKNLLASDLTLNNSGWTKSQAGVDRVKILRQVGISSSNPQPVTDNLNITVSALSNEDYTLIINITNNLSNATVNPGVISVGFDEEEFGDNLTTTATTGERTFTVTSNDTLRPFTSNDEVAVTGDFINSNTTAPSTGVVTVILSGAIPSKAQAASELLSGNIVTRNVRIGPGTGTDTDGEPTIIGATSGEMTPRNATITSNAQDIAGTITANGSWDLEVDSADTWLTLHNIENQAERGGVVTLRATAFVGTSSRVGNVRLTDGKSPSTLLGGITVTQNIEVPAMMGASTERYYDLTAGPNGTVWLLTYSNNGTYAFNLTSNDSATVKSFAPPTTVSGGTGSSIVPGELVGTIENASMLGGNTYIFVGSGGTPGTVPADTVYFEYE